MQRAESLATNADHPSHVQKALTISTEWLPSQQTYGELLLTLSSKFQLLFFHSSNAASSEAGIDNPIVAIDRLHSIYLIPMQAVTGLDLQRNQGVLPPVSRVTFTSSTCCACPP